MENQKITMKDALKRKGWNLDRMADELNCSISQISKVQNGRVTITKEFQEKFQSAFPGYELVNSAINWKEKYLELQTKYQELATIALLQQEELEDHRRVFGNIGKELIKLGDGCEANAENVNHYDIDKYVERPKRKIIVH